MGSNVHIKARTSNLQTFYH